MDWLDAGIVAVLVAAMWHGIALGLVRQLSSTAGLVGGLFVGAFAEAKFSHLAHTTSSRAMLALVIVWGCSAVLWSLGEWLGVALKLRIQHWQIDKMDGALGAIIGGATLLTAVWLGASVFSNVPLQPLRQQINSSRIVATLNSSLPAAPNVVAKLGRIIDPNGFPQVFTGLEPSISTNVPLPDLGNLNTAVQADKASVVKIEGNGCGGIVEGSGFVVPGGLVTTNAHVVAGVRQPEVIDGDGEHDGRVVLFDPNLDLAVLQVNGLRGAPLTINTNTASVGTAAAVLGYPGDGSLTVGAARVLQQFQAVGRNIYDQGQTTRSVYSIKATVRPGNSGGPLIAADGRVIGLVFAQSTAYNQVGYALAMHQVSIELAHVSASSPTVSTGACAE